MCGSFYRRDHASYAQQTAVELTDYDHLYLKNLPIYSYLYIICRTII